MDVDTFSRPNDRRGFLHKKIFGFGKKLLGVGATFLAGPVAPAFSLAQGAFGGGAAPQLPPGSRTQFPTPGFQGRLQRFLPGGASGFTTLPPSLIPRGPGGAISFLPGVQGGISGFAQDGQQPGQCAPPVLGGNRRVNAAGQIACPGMHWNESTYTRLGGPCSSKPAGLVLKGTEQVKNRKRFNTANGPARKRAAARLKASEKDCKEALRAIGFRTISKQSSREMRMRRRGHR